MTKKLAKTLPSEEEIKRTGQLIRNREFIHLASLADMVDRFVDMSYRPGTTSRLTLNALNILVAHGGTLTPTELSRRMYRSKHSITKVVDSLEKEGLIMRDSNTPDRRVTLIRVTAKALNLLSKSLTDSPIARHDVMNCLTREEQEQFSVLVEKLRRELKSVIGVRTTDRANAARTSATRRSPARRV